VDVAFYAEQLYYLPQFTPVIARLRARGHRTVTVVRLDAALRDMPLPGLDEPGETPAVIRVADSSAAYDALRQLAPDWAVFGSFADPAQPLPERTRTALVYHGIGVKTVLFDPRLNAFDLRCVESRRVLEESLARDPSARERLALVGFAKLDPLFAESLAPAPPSGRPVLLYAPTFYPSSLELMPRDLRSAFADARWIVKPHFFSWTVPDYAAQRKRLEAWSSNPAIEVLGPAIYDLVPLMKRADILVSDASSALFEFAALRKPVVWCRFQKLRWSYRGLLSFRLRQRIDPATPKYEAVAHGVDRASRLPQAIEAAWVERRRGPVDEAPQRAALIEHLIGPRDGRASERIVDELERRLSDARAPFRMARAG
jgi:hypothetical protein